MKLDEIIQETADVFEDELDEGYIDCNDDVVRFAVEQADIYLEKLNTEKKMDLLKEIAMKEDGLTKFKIVKELDNIDEAINGLIGTYISSIVLEKVGEIWDESN